MRILLVSQMYPGPGAPDLGTFVAQLERALAERGHEVERAVLDTRAGGKLRYLTLARRGSEKTEADRPRDIQLGERWMDAMSVDRKKSLQNSAGSLKRNIPISTVPAAPIPVQTA